MSTVGKAVRCFATAMLLAGAMTTASAAHAMDCDWRFALTAATGTLLEHADVGALREKALWPGAAVAMAQPLGARCLGLDSWARGGLSGTYQGYTQAGVPHDADVTHVDFGTTLSLRQALGERLQWDLLAGLERFDRAIASGDGIGGVTERYTWYWLGAGGRWDACPRCAFPLSMRASYARLLAGASEVNLFAFGRGVIDFDRGDRYTLDLVVQAPVGDGSRRELALYWERREFAATGTFPVTGATYAVRQPAFDVQDIGLRVSFPFR